MTKVKRYGLTWGRLFFGFERSTIAIKGERYMDRWIIYFIGTLRLHKIYCPDHGRNGELHNHPWWFVTFPLRGYVEITCAEGAFRQHYVEPYRFHYRPLDYQHRIVALEGDRPIWTIVLTGPRVQKWGFFDGFGNFTPHDKR